MLYTEPGYRGTRVGVKPNSEVDLVRFPGYGGITDYSQYLYPYGRDGPAVLYEQYGQDCGFAPYPTRAAADAANPPDFAFRSVKFLPGFSYTVHRLSRWGSYTHDVTISAPLDIPDLAELELDPYLPELPADAPEHLTPSYPEWIKLFYFRGRCIDETYSIRTPYRWVIWNSRSLDGLKGSMLAQLRASFVR